MFGFKKKKDKDKDKDKEKEKEKKKDKESAKRGSRDDRSAGKLSKKDGSSSSNNDNNNNYSNAQQQSSLYPPDQSDSPANQNASKQTDMNGNGASSNLSLREQRKKSLASSVSATNLLNASSSTAGAAGGAAGGAAAGAAAGAAGAVAGAGGGATAASSSPSSQPTLTLLNAPQLKDVPAQDRPMVFQNHLILCQQTFDFTDPNADIEEKEKKRILLLGLVDYANGAKDVFTESIYPDVIAMLSANLFRDLPNREDGGLSEDEEPVLEPAWPHLQIVYEFLLRFVVSSDVDAKVAKKYISHSFLIQLLELFNSEDPREREYLKTILHRVYGKYMALRAFIRRAINNVFYQVMYETERHNGIGELLEILGSIINGFALPLKAEHKRFLVRALIPLHKIKNIHTFHQQLAYCVTQFVEKDPRMAEPIVLGLLRFWPFSSSPKQVLFLNELEDILELVQSAEFSRIVDPLFRRIGVCLDSPHFQVAERTLFLWNNEYLVSLIAQNKHEILPLIIKPLVKNSEHHWNVTVNSLTSNVVKIFIEMDKNFYYECKEAMESEEREKTGKEKKRQQRWVELEEKYGKEQI